ncbi:MAG: hypothetical protein RL337_537, partial [Bacteroidota bacterium]
ILFLISASPLCITIDQVESLPAINCASLANWNLLLIIYDEGCDITPLDKNPSTNKTNILGKCARVRYLKY